MTSPPSSPHVLSQSLITEPRVNLPGDSGQPLPPLTPQDGHVPMPAAQGSTAGGVWRGRKRPVRHTSPPLTASLLEGSPNQDGTWVSSPSTFAFPGGSEGCGTTRPSGSTSTSLASFSSPQNGENRGWGQTSVRRCVFSLHEALGSIRSTQELEWRNNSNGVVGLM